MLPNAIIACGLLVAIGGVILAAVLNGAADEIVDAWGFLDNDDEF